jgi:hypothetical protein
VTVTADEGGAVDRIKRIFVKSHWVCKYQNLSRPTGPMYFVFCRLYPFSSRLPRQRLGPIPVISLLLTNIVSPVRACVFLIIWWERLHWTQWDQCILFSVVFTHSPPGYHGSVWVVPFISLLLTNTVSPVRRGYIGPKQKPIVGLLVFKGPKHEIFGSRVFLQSKPVWVGWLRN